MAFVLYSLIIYGSNELFRSFLLYELSSPSGVHSPPFTPESQPTLHTTPHTAAPLLTHSPFHSSPPHLDPHSTSLPLTLLTLAALCISRGVQKTLASVIAVRLSSLLSGLINRALQEARQRRAEDKDP
ncbi:hypothetical protein E2C01_081966 [Portunus trituberculatus]|uniref:Uncharacterized protein n=1 Tax=Portunus trituberculatus TaxID=210409 RepID=A0A5B7IX90_PORTR|nr:hypothetical protein [Portunus trituberculatus]